MPNEQQFQNNQDDELDAVEENVNQPTDQKGKKIKQKKIKIKVKKGRRKLPLWIRLIGGGISGVFKLIFSVIIMVVITGCIVVTAGTVYFLELINSEPMLDLKTLQLNYTSIVYGKDADGNNIEVQRLNAQENRIWVDYADIPQDLLDAIISVEDEDFLTHSGVDYTRTIAAFVEWFINGDSSYGGSTITQQLVKNINGDISESSRFAAIKIDEIITAMNLEIHFSKEQILEAYVNYIALDNNINGIGAAANYYFGKEVDELDLVECAALAVISKNPSELNPYKNPERAKERRQYAFDKMLEHGKITLEEYAKVYDSDLVLADESQYTGAVKTTEYHSWYVDSLIEEVISDLMLEYGYTRTEASNLIYTSGYRIYSNMDIERQQILEDYFEDYSNFEVAGVEYANELPDAYMQIIDYDGRVIATVGSKGEKVGDRLANKSYTALRPAGSTIKPLAVYTPAFDLNIINWSSFMDDAAVQKVTDPITQIEREWPINYNYQYDGYVPIIHAIQVSKNTIPVRIVNLLTPEYCFDYVYNQLNVKNLIPTGTYNNVNPASLALGDGGTNLAELTAAFQMFGNGGYYTEPKLYEKVCDADGKIILSTESNVSNQVMESDTAYIMNKALRAVVNESPGSGTGANLYTWETVGKTGTSNDKRDLVFIGLTPYYTAGIRYGYDDNSIIYNEGKSQMVVWKEVMTLMHEGLEPATFDLDSTGVYEYQYCTYSGMIAHEGCTATALGYYKPTNTPSVCTHHDASGHILVPILSLEERQEIAAAEEAALANMNGND